MRLAAPSLQGVVRIVAIVVGCAFALYVAWLLCGVLRLVVISLFFALALIPVWTRSTAAPARRAPPSSSPCTQPPRAASCSSAWHRADNGPPSGAGLR